MATTVRQMIAGKTEIHAVEPAATVLDALRLMADKNIGAVLVLSDGILVGIFSERDYARKVALRGLASKDLPVKDVMSTQLVTVGLDWTTDQCMALMDERGIRHLPVVDGAVVAGVISVRAVVQAIVAEQQFTIRHLERYITNG